MMAVNPALATATPYVKEELWHVAIAQDDIKIMNVDQLDDAFRLDIVDASTLVWKDGMAGWERLGVIADIEQTQSDYEPTKQFHAPSHAKRPGYVMPVPPSPPRPPHAKPVTAQTYAKPVVPPTYPRAVAAPTYAQPVVAPPYAKPVVPNRTPDPFGSSHIRTVPARISPLVQTAGRVRLESSVDFRRRSGGVRIGRLLFGSVVLLAVVVGAYRARLLQTGARQLGVEGKYLAAERSLHATISTKAPANVQSALKRYGFLPDSSITLAGSALPAPSAPAAVALAAPAPSATTAVAPKPVEPEESGVKAVSLDSLPLLAADEKVTQPATAEEARPQAAVAARVAPVASPRTRRVTPDVDEESPKVASKPVAKRETSAPKAQAPKAQAPKEPEEAPVKRAAPAPAPVDDNPLKAAIRAEIAKDNSK
jgi:hypothetical protein